MSIHAIHSAIRRPGRPLLAASLLGLAALTSMGAQTMVYAGPQAAASSEDPKPADKPFVVEYYYKAKWGKADEFIRLFKKNHLPVLKKQIEAGRVRSVAVVKPRYHATEDGRWDYRVTITFKDVASAFAPASLEEAIKKELFPDQELFLAEEARRFEILDAHWDTPIEDVELEH